MERDQICINFLEISIEEPETQQQKHSNKNERKERKSFSPK